ncbi:hypothetical protein WICMUC_003969 [Wickerhamomyces mucosus]|uniref:precorrin-2 dehydrogenase n=1 Tax=Wickerhamomyces mucosus TaxID=1378264 RepID=A0A9P8PJ81_9ASCO|nr:hypothetical protein WICMUC_003969 [Wickerhamomyces mucosus]
MSNSEINKLDTSRYPQIEPNGSLLVAWQVKNRHVLVVGGGEVAASRIYHLLNANAKVTVIAPEINDEIKEREEKGLLYAVHRRHFHPSDLKLYETKKLPKLNNFSEDEYKKIDEWIIDSKFELVLVAIDDPIKSKQIYYLAKLQGLNVNIADVPPLCDFYFGAIFRKGFLQILISTNGKGPRMAKLLKDKIGQMFTDVEINKVLENINSVRQGAREYKLQGSENDIIKKRMDWMIKVTENYSIKEWSKIDEDQIDKIVESYPGELPKFPL